MKRGRCEEDTEDANAALAFILWATKSSINGVPLQKYPGLLSAPVRPSVCLCDVCHLHVSSSHQDLFFLSNDTRPWTRPPTVWLEQRQTNGGLGGKSYPCGSSSFLLSALIPIRRRQPNSGNAPSPFRLHPPRVFGGDRRLTTRRRMDPTPRPPLQ